MSLFSKHGAKRWCVAAAWAGLLAWPLVAASPASEPEPKADRQRPAAASSKIDFNRNVRPILAESCFQCHGPDQRARKADLRLDSAAEATKDRGGYAAIVPGNPAESALLSRVTSADPDERMPPLEAQRKLTPAQIKTLAAWIEQGAEYQPHWSLVPPRRAELPRVERASWVRNPIDRFVLARLEAEHLPPSPEADRETLLRRVTLDLTGLPPTMAEMDAFLLDNTPLAYERVVERLLASSRYGERMAAGWLDAARYADTNGYQEDGVRHMWRWRDWVIDAFNRNLPFDQFTIEQLAGDLLPHATLDQRIATGFNRNHRTNSETGIIPEEYLVEYAVDRLDTTATVWLGLTIGCARCHDHKFDPVTQREYYQLLAYFNNVPEQGRAVAQDNSPPLIKAPTADQQQQLAELDQQLAAAESQMAKVDGQLAADQTRWEAALHPDVPLDGSYDEGLVLRFSFDGNAANATPNKVDSKFPEGAPVYAPGVAGQALDLDGKGYVDAGDVANLNESHSFSIGAWILPKGQQGGAVLSRRDADKSAGYYLSVVGGKLQAYFGSHLPMDAIHVETAKPISPDLWHHVMVTYDGSRLAQGVKIFIDGQLAELTVKSDSLRNSIGSSQPLRIGSRGAGDQFSGCIDEVCFYDRKLTAEEVGVVACGDSIHRIAATPHSNRTPSQRSKLRSYFVHHHASEAARLVYHRVRTLQRDRQQLEKAVPTAMVMQEQTPPRDTFILARGEYDKPGEKVDRGLPESLPSLPSGATNDRLGLARWLVDSSNPLTARVVVNRYWQMYFGVGLVKTTEDFGAQGEPPSHSELLDWLATEFVRTGWDVKAMQNLIVTSATYRQSSKVSPALATIDADNRMHARGPRFRLPAGTIRDSALAAAGLLVEKVGGPSVKPYQPPGLWEELTAAKYDQGRGEDLYRRSLYTFWKRTIAPPGMMTFDASSRETCIVRPMRTNTPLQALARLNEVTYVEAARGLAQRMMLEGGSAPGERITFAFRLATGRHPSGEELRVLTSGLEKQLARYGTDPASAEKLIGFGESKYNERLKATDLAAYTTLAGVILNLDEAITKE